MKKLFVVLLFGLSFCVFADANPPAPITFTTQLKPINPEAIDSQVLSQMAVQFNGSKNPQVIIVLDNAIIKYYDGNSNYDWKVLHSGTGWDGALKQGGGGTTKIVSQMAVQFNDSKNPYIVVGEWGGFVDFYNGDTWQAISDRNWAYSNVSSLWVQFNGANYPSVVAGFGSGDGDINFYNGNSDLTWTKLNPNSDYFQYTMAYTVKYLFVQYNGPDNNPSIITLMDPIDPVTPIFLYYYNSSKNTWYNLVASSYLDYYVSQVSAQFDSSNYYMALSVLPNAQIPNGISRIAFFNGSKWNNLQETQTSMTGKFDIQFNGSKNPYIVATTTDSKVQFFDGDNWIELPNPNLTITKLYTQFNGTNKPYIVAGDNSNVIRFFNGQQWVELCSGEKALTSNMISGKSSIMRVNFNGDKNPCIVLGDIQNDNAFFFNGSSWVSILKNTDLAKEHKAEQQLEKDEIGASGVMENDTLQETP
ncbi:MAG: hypothetical protein WCR55_07220 [Lentisphaerota bacterium]